MNRASCLCRKVEITVVDVRRKFTACHCDMCRKWGGTWMAAECASGVVFEGSEAISVYPSSDWAERGFCSTCGTHLFFKHKNEDKYFIPVGLFDDQVDFDFRRQIFIDRKPDYYCFANETLEVTEAGDQIDRRAKDR